MAENDQDSLLDGHVSSSLFVFVSHPQQALASTTSARRERAKEHFDALLCVLYPHSHTTPEAIAAVPDPAALKRVVQFIETKYMAPSSTEANYCSSTFYRGTRARGAC